MCGIIGTVVKNPESCGLHLYKIFKAQQDRGVLGGGISLLRDGKLSRYRVTNPFDLFSIEYKSFWEDLKKNDILLVHHRWPTSSDNSENFNHPISNEFNTVHLIHNGVISDYEKVFKKLKSQGHKFETESEGKITDSEVLVHYLENEKKLFKSINRLNNEVHGSYAVAFIYKGTNYIYLYTNGNPIVTYSDLDGNLYFSSECVMNGFKDVKNLNDDTLYKYSKDGLKPVRKFYVKKVAPTTTYFEDNWELDDRNNTWSEKKPKNRWKRLMELSDD